MTTRLLCTLLVLLSASLFAADEPLPEAGERALTAVETDRVLDALAQSFKAHPIVRASISSEIEDLAGKRTEEGTLLLDRANADAVRVLRVFTTPKPKAWLLSGTTISEFVPSKKLVYVKDLSAAPNALKHIRAAMTGDVKALNSIFTIHMFKGVKAPPESMAVRVVLDKKPGASKFVHRRIEARLSGAMLFFDEIHYIPDEGDELTERFTHMIAVSTITDADFDLPGAAGVERKVEAISE